MLLLHNEGERPMMIIYVRSQTINKDQHLNVNNKRYIIRVEEFCEFFSKRHFVAHPRGFLSSEEN